jgi:hypothetical protein
MKRTLFGLIVAVLLAIPTFIPSSSFARDIPRYTPEGKEVTVVCDVLGQLSKYEYKNGPPSKATEGNVTVPTTDEIIITPVDDGRSSADEQQINCYSADSAPSHTAKGFMPAAATQYEWGRVFINYNQTGSILRLYGTVPCQAGYLVSMNSMPSGWDNVVSSGQRAPSPCSGTVLFDNTNLQGYSEQSPASSWNCSPTMNDRTSSWYVIAT